VPFRDGHYAVECPVQFSHLDDLEPRARFIYGETPLTCDHCLGCPDGRLEGRV
jgi:hypothetical protein